MPLLLETVVTLQKNLDKLDDLEQRLAGMPEEMRELHQRYTSAKTEIDRLEAIIEEAGSERRTAEAASEDCATKLQHYQAQVNRVRTQREYSAILQEIDLAKEQSRALEDQALAAMERQEEAETELSSLREGFDEIDRQYQVELEKWEAAKPRVAEQAETLRVAITGLKEQIPRPSLLLFDRVREFNRGQALAAVRRVQIGPRGPNMWHCAACNYNVRPQIVVEIKNNGSLIQCDSCKRILFIEEPTG